MVDYVLILFIEPSTCSYVYTFRHPAACPTDLPQCRTLNSSSSCSSQSNCQWCYTGAVCIPITESCTGNCGMITRNQMEFDLRPLARPTGAVADWTLAQGINTYYLNPCNLTTTKCSEPTPVRNIPCN
jgi:hypothetical protein